MALLWLCEQYTDSVETLSESITRLLRGFFGMLRARLGRDWGTTQGRTLLCGGTVMQALGVMQRLRGGGLDLCS